jgi:hypothetical protein
MIRDNAITRRESPRLAQDYIASSRVNFSRQFHRSSASLANAFGGIDKSESSSIAHLHFAGSVTEHVDMSINGITGHDLCARKLLKETTARYCNIHFFIVVDSHGTFHGLLLNISGPTFPKSFSGILGTIQSQLQRIDG